MYVHIVHTSCISSDRINEIYILLLYFMMLFRSIDCSRKMDYDSKRLIRIQTHQNLQGTNFVRCRHFIQIKF